MNNDTGTPSEPAHPDAARPGAPPGPATPEAVSPPGSPAAPRPAGAPDTRFGTPNVRPVIIEHEDGGKAAAKRDLGAPPGASASVLPGDSANAPSAAKTVGAAPPPPAAAPGRAPLGMDAPRNDAAAKSAPASVPPAPPAGPPPGAPRAAPAARPAGGAANTLLTLVLFGAAAGGIYYTWTNPKTPAGADDAATTALHQQLQADAAQAAQASSAAQAVTQQVQALAERVDRIEKAQAASAATATQAAAAPAPAAQESDSTALAQRLDALSAKVDALANRPAPAAEAPPAAVPDTAALRQDAVQAGTQAGQSAGQEAGKEAGAQAAQQEVAGLSQKLDQSLGSAGQKMDALAAAQKAALDALSARLDHLEQGAGQVESAADRAARLGRVQAASLALDAGRKLGPVPGAPPEVTRYADTAPPTEAALREAFPAVAAQARAVSQPDLANRGFLDRALARLQQSVTVRQGSDVLVGDPQAGVLAEAQNKVSNADLRGAVTVLARLQGPAATAVQPWVEQVRGLLAARDALAAMAARN